MKTLLAAIVGTSAFAFATTAWSGTGYLKVPDSIITSEEATVQPSYLAAQRPEYIVYSDSAAALPGPNCYWTRQPVYDADFKVVGWRGRPLAVCPQASQSAQAGK